MEKQMKLHPVPMEKGKRIHHVGSITFGVSLILCGLIYLIHVFIPALEVLQVIQLWPCVLILLGIEVLVANAQDKVEFVYDKAAILMTALLLCFAIGMAGVDFLWQYTNS